MTDLDLEDLIDCIDDDPVYSWLFCLFCLFFWWLV